MLLSLNLAYGGASSDLEVLCSWNGDNVDSKSFLAVSRYQFQLIVQKPYSFPLNVNSLAAIARGRYLLLLNDDVLLDPLAINAALELHEHTLDAGIIGAVLRRRDGVIAHIGIAFEQDNNPYHIIEGMREAGDGCFQESYRVPAVTGACMLLLRSDYELLGLDPSYDVYGEDVDLCLRFRRLLFKDIWCCVGLTGIHEASTTRKLVGTDNPNAKDSGRISCAHKYFMESCQKSELLLELLFSQMEISLHREIILSLQSLVSSQQALANTRHTSALTDAFVDTGEAEVELIGHDFHITTQLRHERLGEIHHRVMQATNEISELRELSVLIYQVLTDPRQTLPDSPSSLLDILYDQSTSLVNQQLLAVDP
jgi:hypothetical protein